MRFLHLSLAHTKKSLYFLTNIILQLKTIIHEYLCKKYSIFGIYVHVHNEWNMESNIIDFLDKYIQMVTH